MGVVSLFLKIGPSLFLAFYFDWGNQLCNGLASLAFPFQLIWPFNVSIMYPKAAKDSISLDKLIKEIVSTVAMSKAPLLSKNFSMKKLYFIFGGWKWSWTQQRFIYVPLITSLGILKKYWYSHYFFQSTLYTILRIEDVLVSTNVLQLKFVFIYIHWYQSLSWTDLRAVCIYLSSIDFGSVVESEPTVKGLRAWIQVIIRILDVKELLIQIHLQYEV